MTRTASSISVWVRWMIRRDLPEVLAAETTTDHGWTEDDILRCLRKRNCIGFVAEHGGVHVVGHMLYELHRTRLEILNFAVSPEYRNRGVGTALMGKLKSKLGTHRRQSLGCVVRESNTPLLTYLRRHGFRAVRYARGHFDDGDDGVRLQFSEDHAKREAV